MEQLDFNLLFRWFVGLGLDDRVWDPSTFSHNRDRLLAADVSTRFLHGIVTHKKVRRLLSRDHFSVDGTLIAAWASMKSFRPKAAGDQEGDDREDGKRGGGRTGKPKSPTRKGRNRERDFRGEKRSNQTHRSTTDGDARLLRKRRVAPGAALARRAGSVIWATR